MNENLLSGNIIDVHVNCKKDTRHEVMSYLQVMREMIIMQFSRLHDFGPGENAQSSNGGC